MILTQIDEFDAGNASEHSTEIYGGKQKTNRGGTTAELVAGELETAHPVGAVRVTGALHTVPGKTKKGESK